MQESLLNSIGLNIQFLDIDDLGFKDHPDRSDERTREALVSDIVAARFVEQPQAGCGCGYDVVCDTQDGGSLQNRLVAGPMPCSDGTASEPGQF